LNEFKNESFTKRTGLIAVVGRPNVGKSTLVNALVGKDLSITSKHSHTTRSQVRAIANGDYYQMVFVDTPGIHKPKFKISEQLNEAAYDALDGVDLILAVFDGSASIGKGDGFIAQHLAERKNVHVVINKCDSVNKIETIAKRAQELSQLMPNAKNIFMVSAFTSKNISLLKKEILNSLEPGPQFFETDVELDMSDEKIVGEMFRESLIRLLKEELPQELGVVAKEIEELSKADRRYFDVRILVTRNSHKPIVIGKGGSMLETAGTRARKRIQALLDSKVVLKARVEVDQNWQSNPHYLNS
jgi:GTP-binding protein Era